MGTGNRSQSARESGGVPRRRLAAVGLLGFALLLVPLYSGNLYLGQVPETLSATVTAHSLVRERDFDVSEYFPPNQQLDYAFLRRDGRVYTMEPLVSPLTFAPFFLPYLGVAPLDLEQTVANDKIASRVAALTIAILGAWLLTLAAFPRALAATATTALATSHWTIAAGGLWSHASAVLWLSIGLFLWSGAVRRARLYPLAGCALAFATLCRPTLLPAALLVALDAWRRPGARRVAAATLGLVAGIGATGLFYNWQLYGSLLGGRAEIFAGITQTHAVSTYFAFSPLNLVGLLAAPSRGLFVYSPVLLFALPGLVRGLRGAAAAPRLMSVAGVGVFLLYGFVATWWGGWVYGPRYMTDLLPFFTLWLAQAPVPRVRRPLWGALAAAALAWSVWVQYLGATRYPCGWNSQPVSVDAEPDRAWSLRDTQIARCVSIGARATKRGAP
jgi:hypothetical protein